VEGLRTILMGAVAGPLPVEPAKEAGD
jgi:hypothetical protein